MPKKKKKKIKNLKILKKSKSKVKSKSILKTIKEESNSRLIKIWESITRLNVEQIIFSNSIIEINGDSIKITRK